MDNEQPINPLQAAEKIAEDVSEEGTLDDYNFVGDEATYLLKMQIIDGLRENGEQRRRYARRTFWLTVAWITLVILIVGLCGITDDFKFRLRLSEGVIITLITTTTINVFGFFLLVMKYLFNTKELTELKELFTKK